MDSGDTAWVLISSALVLLMVPGLAFFYGGLVRSKNVTATIMHSFISMAVVSVVWVLWGYSLAFGPDVGHFIGNLDYIGLRGVLATETGPYADTIPHQAFMIFQAMFAIITPALITGAFAERIKFSTLVIFTVVWSTIVYAPLAHWVWGVDGWLGLNGWGALDFAGGTVVHISSGVAALAAAGRAPRPFAPSTSIATMPTRARRTPVQVLEPALPPVRMIRLSARPAKPASTACASRRFATTTAPASPGRTVTTARTTVSAVPPAGPYAATASVKRVTGKTACRAQPIATASRTEDPAGGSAAATAMARTRCRAAIQRAAPARSVAPTRRPVAVPPSAAATPCARVTRTASIARWIAARRRFVGTSPVILVRISATARPIADRPR